MNFYLWSVIKTSLLVSLCSTALVMSCALFFTPYFLKSRSILVKCFEVLLYLPMAMPPVALGYGLLLLLSQNSWLGGLLYRYLGLELAFTFAAAVIAAFAVSLGIGLQSIRIALEGLDDDEVAIAELLGATRWQIFWQITLPKVRPALLGGAALVFIRSLSEFGATMVFAGNSLGETRTLAMAIWTAIQSPGQERTVWFLVLIAFFISILAIGFTEIIYKKCRS